MRNDNMPPRIAGRKEEISLDEHRAISAAIEAIQGNVPYSTARRHPLQLKVKRRFESAFGWLAHQKYVLRCRMHHEHSPAPDYYPAEGRYRLPGHEGAEITVEHLTALIGRIDALRTRLKSFKSLEPEKTFALLAARRDLACALRALEKYQATYGSSQPKAGA
jgi:hypothetical protein